jgi:hypothetical protein
MALEAMGSDRVSVTFSVRMGARMEPLLLPTSYETETILAKDESLKHQNMPSL